MGGKIAVVNSNKTNCWCAIIDTFDIYNVRFGRNSHWSKFCSEIPIYLSPILNMSFVKSPR